MTPTPTDLNLFFVQSMLQPEDTGGWNKFLTRRQNAKRYAADPEKAKRAAIAYWKKNPDRVKAGARRRYAEDPAAAKAAIKAWAQANPDQTRKLNRDWRRKRRAKDVAFKILCYLRTRIYRAVTGLKKSIKTRELIGMDLQEFKIYLRGQFSPGMTWENYGPIWHIDHIRPCASFDLTNAAQQRECFNWSNCQPLFAEDNLRKGDRVSH